VRVRNIVVLVPFDVCERQTQQLSIEAQRALEIGNAQLSNNEPDRTFCHQSSPTADRTARESFQKVISRADFV
jgi:hypothetical protein